jgi:hypothetical protein
MKLDGSWKIAFPGSGIHTTPEMQIRGYKPTQFEWTFFRLHDEVYFAFSPLRFNYTFKVPIDEFYQQNSNETQVIQVVMESVLPTIMRCKSKSYYKDWMKSYQEFESILQTSNETHE